MSIRDISQKLLKLWLNFNDIEFCLISHKDKDHSLCAKEIASRGIKLIGPDYKNIDCFIEWPKQGMANPQVTTQIVSEQYNSHLLSRQTAIRRPNPEWSDKEVEEELKRIEAEENQTSEETTDDEVTEVA